MREILFRGKRVDTGQWVISDCFFQCVGEIKLWDNPNRDGWVCVKAETIGQYTGLTDKNGTKIFEGDIVEIHDKATNIHWTAIIEFGNPNSDYCWGWQLKPLKILKPTAVKEFYWNKSILCWVEMECAGVLCEVIGNIYDNPELLQNVEE